jgi:hypothetical protein
MLGRIGTGGSSQTPQPARPVVMKIDQPAGPPVARSDGVGRANKTTEAARRARPRATGWPQPA